MSVTCLNWRNTFLFMLLLFYPILCIYAQFAGGNGTIADPYQIATAEHLNNIRNYRTFNFIQTADIDLNIPPFNQGEGWVRIGSGGNEFTGAYDGNNFAIENLYINRPISGQVDGLFATTQNAVLKNISLENVNITGRIVVGGLVGISGFTQFINCYVDGMITGHNNVGGLAGTYCSDSTMNHCLSNCTITGRSFIGGLVGDCNQSTIDSCYSVGVINGTNAANYVGGLVGYVHQGSVNNCYSAVDLNGWSCIGGLIGYVYYSEVTNSFSIGSVVYTNPGKDPLRMLGGLIGLRTESIVSNSYWNTETSGQSSSDGGSGRTTEQMTYPYALNTYTDWDFNTIWASDENYTSNYGYPYLRNMPTTPNEDYIIPAPQISLLNYPNPFSFETVISFTLPKAADVTLKIYNLKGRLVRTLINDFYSKGEHKIIWDKKDARGKFVRKGIFIYRLSGSDFQLSRKMTLLD